MNNQCRRCGEDFASLLKRQLCFTCRAPKIEIVENRTIQTISPVQVKAISVRRVKAPPRPVIQNVKEYKSLRSAVIDPRPPVAKLLYEVGQFFVVPEGGFIQTKRWVVLARAEKYKTLKITIIWSGNNYTVEGYILARNNVSEARQMLAWWNELLSIVPKELSPVYIPSDEELIQQWKEFESRINNNANRALR